MLDNAEIDRSKWSVRLSALSGLLDIYTSRVEITFEVSSPIQPLKIYLILYLNANLQ